VEVNIVDTSVSVVPIDDVVQTVVIDNSVTAATVVGGAGTTVKEDHTFDGYTIAQVVNALRTMGILA